MIKRSTLTKEYVDNQVMKAVDLRDKTLEKFLELEDLRYGAGMERNARGETVEDERDAFCQRVNDYIDHLDTALAQQNLQRIAISTTQSQTTTTTTTTVTTTAVATAGGTATTTTATGGNAVPLGTGGAGATTATTSGTTPQPGTPVNTGGIDPNALGQTPQTPVLPWAGGNTNAVPIGRISTSPSAAYIQEAQRLATEGMFAPNRRID